jgi:UDP-N-acetylmuramate--alanine ligase
MLSCDVFFPVLHGPFGEDGMIQGFFETLNKTYVGCDYLSSAFCMNKAWVKYLVEKNGFKTNKFIQINKTIWKEEKDKIIEDIEKKLVFPIFIKGVHLGSSFSIYKVENKKNLLKAIEKTFLLDDILIVEEKMEGKEIEFSVIGNDKIYVSFPAEVIPKGDVYSFEEKYEKNKNITFANISKKQIKEGEKIAKKIFQLIGCSGMARIDFFFDGNFYFNEINPIPGFTKDSLFHKMWKKSNLGFESLLDKLIILAMHKKRKNKNHETKIYNTFYFYSFNFFCFCHLADSFYI